MVARRHKMVSEVKTRVRKQQRSSLRKCTRCGRNTFKAFAAEKCVACGYTGQEFGKTLEDGWKLKVTFDPKEQRVTILGNAKGLEFFAGCCLAVIGKTDPSGHIHLEWQMNNLVQGSTPTLVEFSDDEEDYPGIIRGHNT